jgi:hypothetical protein
MTTLYCPLRAGKKAFTLRRVFFFCMISILMKRTHSWDGHYGRLVRQWHILERRHGKCHRIARGGPLRGRFCSKCSRSYALLNPPFRLRSASWVVPVITSDLSGIARVKSAFAILYRPFFHLCRYRALPFKTILTHGFVLDSEGKKMSKSLGNVVSPNNIINGIF